MSEFQILDEIIQNDFKINTIKRTPLKFEDRNGLKCLSLSCNKEYRLEQFREAV